jgi:hypothetical protein
MSEAAQRFRRPVIRRGMVLLAALAAMLLLSWPALLNGGAFFFPDTGTYLRSADTIVGELTGEQSAWSDRRQFYEEAPQIPPTPTAAPAPAVKAQPAAGVGGGAVHPVLLGRSIYYGLMVFPFVVLFGSLAAVTLQAALAVLTIWLTLAAFGCDRSRMPARLLAVAALLAVLTSLPFFVSMLMPDVFAGFAIALAASAAAGWQRLARWERVCLAVLLVFSAMAHSSHVLVLVALAAITVLVTLLTRARATAAVGLMALAAVSGIAGEQLFVYAVTHRLGEPPIRPPFLTARLIDDGPGFRLLTDRCPSIELAACRYLDRMPQDSDTFLWSFNRSEGIFSTEAISVQRDLASQDARFAIETVHHDPVGVIVSSARNIARQMALTDINIFNYVSGMGGDVTLGMPEPFASEIRASRFGSATMPVAFSRWANLATAIAAAFFLVAVLLGRTRERDLGALRNAAGLFLAAVALNATITGAMSKPHDRYNIRVIWVLQLAALAILTARFPRKRLEQN